MEVMADWSVVYLCLNETSDNWICTDDDLKLSQKHFMNFNEYYLNLKRI
jgi:hypothetical protein